MTLKTGTYCFFPEDGFVSYSIIDILHFLYYCHWVPRIFFATDPNFF